MMLNDNAIAVNRHQFQILLERFADLADWAVSNAAIELCAGGGVWVHDLTASHPCDYACGAVFIERTATEIVVNLGNTTFAFRRDPEAE